MASTCKYNNSSLYNTISHYPNYSKLNSSGLFGELRHIFLNLIARSLGCPLSFPDPSRLTDIYSMQSSNTELWEAYAQSIKVMKFHDRCLTCHVMSSSRQCKKKTENGNICCSRSAQSVSNTNPYYKSTVETACSWLGLP